MIVIIHCLQLYILIFFLVKDYLCLNQKYNTGDLTIVLFINCKTCCNVEMIQNYIFASSLT